MHTLCRSGNPEHTIYSTACPKPLLICHVNMRRRAGAIPRPRPYLPADGEARVVITRNRRRAADLELNRIRPRVDGVRFPGWPRSGRSARRPSLRCSGLYAYEDADGDRR